MIGLALALLLVGIVFVFVIPWVGIAVGLIGIVLAGLWLLGFGRSAIERREPTKRRP